MSPDNAERKSSDRRSECAYFRHEKSVVQSNESTSDDANSLSSRWKPDDRDDDLLERLSSFGDIEKSSLDRYLPEYNVAVNVCTKLQYDKYVFVMFFRVVRDDCPSFAGAPRRFLRCFMCRKFEGEKAQRVKDVLTPLYSCFYRRIFGGSTNGCFDAYANDEATDDRYEERNLAWCITEKWRRRTTRCDSSKERIVLPNVFAYVMNVDSRIKYYKNLLKTDNDDRAKKESDDVDENDDDGVEDASTKDEKRIELEERHDRGDIKPLEKLFRDRFEYEKMLAACMKDEKFSVTQTAILKKLERRLRKRKSNSGNRDADDNNNDDDHDYDSEEASYETKRIRRSVRIPTEVSDSWESSLFPVAGHAVENGDDERSDSRHGTKRIDAIDSIFENSASDDVDSEDPVYFPLPLDYSTRKLSSSSSDDQLFESYYNELTKAQLSALDDDNVPSHAVLLRRFANKRWSEARVLDIWRTAFASIDSKLFDDRRLDFDYDRNDELSYERAALSAWISIVLQVFFARNKLNDVARFVALSTVANNSKCNDVKSAISAATFYDYAKLMDPVSCRRTFASLSARSLTIPLEWIDNEVVDEAIVSWSRFALRFFVYPSDSIRGDTNDREINYRFIRVCFANDCRGRVEWVRREKKLLPGAAAKIEEEPQRRPKSKFVSAENLVFPSSLASNAASTFVSSFSSFVPAESYPFSVATTTSPTTAAVSVRAPSSKFVPAESYKFSDAATIPPRAPSIDPFSNADFDASDDPFRFVRLNASSMFSSRRFGPAKKWFVLQNGRNFGRAFESDETERERESNETRTSISSSDMIKVVFVKKLPRNRGSIEQLETARKNFNRSESTATSVGASLEISENTVVADGRSKYASPTADIRSLLLARKDDDKPKQPCSSDKIVNSTVDRCVLSFLRSTAGANEANGGSSCSNTEIDPDLCIEQLLFVELFVATADAVTSILVNGNPGSGKSTVMRFVTEFMDRDAINLLPTNVLKQRVLRSFDANDPSKFSHPFDYLAKNNAEVVLPQRYSRGRNVPIVITSSAFLKRVMRYGIGPEQYSRLIERRLDEQKRRMMVTLRPMSIDHDLKSINSCMPYLTYSPVVQIDEYNLCHFQELKLMFEACRRLRVAALCYGDFAQSAPIRAANDNAELVALSGTFSVQFMDNKRMIMRVQDDDGCRVRLLQALRDPVWNWKSNNSIDCDASRVRDLIERTIVRPIREQRSSVDEDEAAIVLAENELNVWFEGVRDLIRWYDEAKCRRYVATVKTAEEIVRRVPVLRLPCVISLRNRDSDRVNRIVSDAIRFFVRRKCDESRRQINSSDAAGSSVFQPFNYYVTSRRSTYLTQNARSEVVDSIVREKIVLDPFVYHAHSTIGETVSSNVDDLVSSRFRDEDREEESLLDDNDDDNDRDESGALRVSNESNDDENTDETVAAINDDPWCAELTLFVGGVYRLLGDGVPGLAKDSLLLLLAFVPHDDKKAVGPKSSTDVNEGVYTCIDTNSNGKSCDVGCHRQAEICDFVDRHRAKRGQFRRTDNVVTIGCGVPSSRRVDRSKPFVFVSPKLLMLRISSIDVGPNDLRFDSDNLFLIDKMCYKLNRCNSVWTPNLYTKRNPREGMSLYGYPLSLSCGVSAWRVQGETISRNDVYVDLRNMSKSQALVSLSRVRRGEQLRDVINVDRYGPIF